MQVQSKTKLLQIPTLAFIAKLPTWSINNVQLAFYSIYSEFQEPRTQTLKQWIRPNKQSHEVPDPAHGKTPNWDEKAFLVLRGTKLSSQFR